MSILFRYVSREVLAASLLAVLALLGLFSFFDFISELGDTHASTYTPVVALAYVALNTPVRLYELVPVALLIGSLFAWNRLALASEFSVMRAAGLSMYRLVAWMLALGTAVGMLTLLLGEYVTPYAEQAAKQLKARATTGVVAREFRTGLWAKDGNTFINIGSVLPDGGLRKLRVFEYRDATHLGRTLTAESASFLGGQQWALDRVTETTFGSDVSVVQHERTDWHSVLTPNMLSVLQVEPARLSIGGLWEYINHLNANQQNARRFEVALWGKFVYPLATCVLMLLALPFAQIQQRAGGIGMRIFVGILLGLVFIVGNRLFSYLALLYEWPPFLGAIVPAVIFLVAGTVMLLRLERR